MALCLRLPRIALTEHPRVAGCLAQQPPAPEIGEERRRDVGSLQQPDDHAGSAASWRVETSLILNGLIAQMPQELVDGLSGCEATRRWRAEVRRSGRTVPLSSMS